MDEPKDTFRDFLGERGLWDHEADAPVNQCELRTSTRHKDCYCRVTYADWYLSLAESPSGSVLIVYGKEHFMREETIAEKHRHSPGTYGYGKSVVMSRARNDGKE